MPEPSRRSVRGATDNNVASLRKREYYEKNRATLIEYSKKYVEAHKEETRAYKRQWHLKNKAKIVAKATKWNKENHDRRKQILEKYRIDNHGKVKQSSRYYRQRRRLLVIDYYSDGENRCKCCGEATYEFLSIDHIDGGGSRHRETTKTKGGHHFYAWLVKNNYPKGFQVLCFNCNMSKGFLGYCPHAATQTMPL